MDGLTINEAAQTTGWSPRMLRYIERVGLVTPRRSNSSYRLFGAEELQRLRTLRELLDAHEIALSDVGFVVRLRRDRALRAAVDAWLDAAPVRPPQVPASDWLRWEQEKHKKLINATLEAAAA